MKFVYILLLQKDVEILKSIASTAQPAPKFGNTFIIQANSLVNLQLNTNAIASSAVRCLGSMNGFHKPQLGAPLLFRNH